MTVANVVSISGGKDSTATALHAIESGAANLTFVFADTGHEHAITYEYIDYLDGLFRRLAGVGVTTVRADFSQAIQRKRYFIARDQRIGRDKRGRRRRWSNKAKRRALAVLQPTGVPMLDLCLAKGRFPSSRRRFCTQELKRQPIEQNVIDPLMRKHAAVISWQGIRADESRARARLPMRESELGTWTPRPAGLLIYRPLLYWSVDDVFGLHRRHGVLWNPLYERGMSRVGCMPCIMARKTELAEIARRYPDAFDRLARYERLVSSASKRGISTFFAANTTPGHQPGTIARDPGRAYSARTVERWAKYTARGGRQYDLEAMIAADQPNTQACSSVYGLCE